MKTAIHQIYSNLNNEKIFHWIKLVSVTGGAQAIVQATGLLSGILIIRLLSVQEYAYYTIANTMLGTMTLLSDGGISTGVMSLGGQVWKDKEKLGTIIATGLELRRKFAVVSLIMSVPILVYLLLHQGATLSIATLITLALIPAYWAAISDSILEITPKLHQEIIPLQKNQLSVSIGRLLLNGIALFFTPYTFIAVLSNGLPRIYGNVKLRKMTDKYISKQQTNSIVKNEMLEIVKKILPGAVYYCLSSQITIWLLSFMGKTVAVAQVGALSRISMVLGTVSAAFTVLIVPRFARLKNQQILYKRFIEIVILLFIICVIFSLFFYVYPNLALSFLGDGYKSLQIELIMSISASCFSLMGGVAFSLYSSRGWVIKPEMLISLNLLSTVILIFLVDISNTSGALKFNILSSFIFMLVHTVFGLIKTLQVKSNILVNQINNDTIPYSK